MSASLADLGWSEHFANAYQRLDLPAHWRPMRIARQDRDFYRVIGEGATPGRETDAEQLARIAGVLRLKFENRADYPAVGDWVVVEPKPHGHWVIQDRLPRHTSFSRQAAGERAEEQVVAANVDVVFLIVGMDANFNLRRLERYIRLAHSSGALPVVLLNKVDVAEEPYQMSAAAVRVAGDTDLLVISATAGTGLDAVHAYLAPGRTIAFLGSSGVGKSTLINALIGEERQATFEVGAEGRIGRHTTTARELILLAAGGMLIDTPGMRELQIWDDDEPAADQAFADIAALAGQCRFSDCSHRHEPDCAVTAAIVAGELDAKRLASYHKQKDELAETHRRQTRSDSTDRPSRRRPRRKK